MTQKCIAVLLFIGVLFSIVTAQGINLVLPFDNSVTSEAFQGITYNFDSPGLVDGGTINLDVNGTVFTLADPELTWIAPNLFFTPSLPFADGDVIAHALSVNYDGSDTTVSASFTVDLTGPYMIDRRPGEVGEAFPYTTTDVLEPIFIYITDDWGEINPNTIMVEIKGMVYDITSPGLSFDPAAEYVDPITGDTLIFGLISFYPDLEGTAWDLMDVVNVDLLSADDLPDYGMPSSLQGLPINNWFFLVDAQSPMAVPIEPYFVWDETVYTSCFDQIIVINLWDANGIVPTSILLRVEGVIYDTTAPELTYNGFTGDLVFVPNPPFFNGQHVDVELIEVIDVWDNAFSSMYSLEWTFVVDKSGPYVVDFYPPDEYTTIDPEEHIWFSIFDDFGYVDPLSIFLIIENSNGDRMEYLGIDPFMPEIVWYEGLGVYEFIPEEIGYTYNQGDTIYVTVWDAADIIDYCSPNHLVERVNWQFYVTNGPFFEMDYPQHNTYSACSQQIIHFYLQDPDDIQPNSIILEVEGVPYTAADPELYVVDNEVFFDPSLGALPPYFDGQEVNIVLWAAEDLLGNPLEHSPIEWSYIVDLSGPYPVNPMPPDGGYAKGPYPEISIDIVDEICGDIDNTLTNLRVDGINYSAYGDYPAVELIDYGWGDQMVFHGDLIGVPFEDGQVIEACLMWAYDDPDYQCTIHSNPFVDAPFCWTFTIDGSPPNPSIVEPGYATYSACAFQQIVVQLFDLNDIDLSSILFICQGHLYDIDSPELDYDPGTGNLIFTPSTPFMDGEIVHYSVVQVADVLGNLITDSPLIAYFYVDLTPPAVAYTVPPADGDVAYFLDEIEIALDDASGIDWTTVAVMVIIGADTFNFDAADPQVTWDDGTMYLDTAPFAGLFVGGVEVWVNVVVGDGVGFACPDPNFLDYTFSFFINPGWEVELVFEMYDTTYDTLGVMVIDTLRQVLTMGANLEATAAYDFGIDVEVPAAILPTFVLDGRKLLQDLRNLTDMDPLWEVWTSGNMGVMLWDPATLPNGYSFVINGYLDMREIDRFAFDMDEIIDIGVSMTMIILYEGWNFVSIPVIPFDAAPGAIFPDPDLVFEFTPDGYVSPFAIEPGHAYFVLNPDPDPVYITVPGTPVTNIVIDLITGWNTFGGIYNFGGIDFSTRVENPAGCVYDYLLFGYDAVLRTYTLATAVKAGMGYFVYARVPAPWPLCEMTLDAGFGPLPPIVKKLPEEEIEWTHTITLTSGDNSATLTIGRDDNASAAYDAGIDIGTPPATPNAQLDAYLVDTEIGRLTTDIRGMEDNCWILNVNANDVVTISTDKLELEGQTLTLENNSNIIDLTNGTETELLPGSYMLKLVSASPNVPADYALYQNVPNPFNATTTISYDVPEESRVKLEIHNILGHKVTTLVDGIQTPGTKTITWNGKNDNGDPVHTGVYFYRLETSKTNFVKKMILMK